MAAKTALLFGASGLIGSYVLEELIRDERYDRIIIFTRKPLDTGSNKVAGIITTFENDPDFEKQILGDEIYCCLGTTIRKAGSQEAFRKVDFNLPLQIGKAAVKNGVPKMMVVSSLGADAKSSNFYLRTKGEMEAALSAMGPGALYFFRPSMLLGPRKESRPAETIGKYLMSGLSFLFVGGLKKYRAIEAHTVARAMIMVANEPHANPVIESEEIARLGA